MFARVHLSARQSIRTSKHENGESYRTNLNTVNNFVHGELSDCIENGYTPEIAQWYHHPLVARVVPGSSPMKNEEFFYEHF